MNNPVQVNLVVSEGRLDFLFLTVWGFGVQPDQSMSISVEQARGLVARLQAELNTAPESTSAG